MAPFLAWTVSSALRRGVGYLRSAGLFFTAMGLPGDGVPCPEARVMASASMRLWLSKAG